MPLIEASNTSLNSKKSSVDSVIKSGFYRRNVSNLVEERSVDSISDYDNVKIHEKVLPVI